MTLNTPLNTEESAEHPHGKVYGSVLLAFHYYSAEWIDLPSMITIMQACNCPDPMTAQKILSNMVTDQYLEWSRIDEKVCFRRTELGKKKTPPPPPGPIPRTVPYN